MQTFEDITSARRAINRFDTDSLPAHLVERFENLAASPSPVDQIVGLGEFVYANADQLDDAARDLGAGLVAFATVNAWHGLLDDNRGDRIVGSLRYAMGEIKTKPDFPEPRPAYRIDPPAQDGDEA